MEDDVPGILFFTNAVNLGARQAQVWGVRQMGRKEKISYSIFLGRKAGAMVRLLAWYLGEPSSTLSPSIDVSLGPSSPSVQCRCQHCLLTEVLWNKPTEECELFRHYGDAAGYVLKLEIQPRRAHLSTT
ncbi:hypothetical protein KIL84_015812 [Mauremys mutica]|uniref:Uncharacterized protein n=1 Tax=Mauremys mutica TaxID=74926 RepID=A0A9D3WT80_9SAUR|nr:hypothetical protein KIL84_015812 [Mauremys mutica]